MRKFVHATVLLVCGVFAAMPLNAQSEMPQSNDLKVYVSPLQGSDAELAKSIREKLIRAFEKHGIFVTESSENADAILTGSGLMQSSFATSVGHRPTLHIRASMRLVNKNGVALWAADVSSSRYAVSESASFVEKVAGKVVDAMAEESKRRSSEPVAQRDKGTN
jgi:hypothetical protein